MKKLFLTSGIIACMACPAFATGYTATNGAVNDNGVGDCVNEVIGTYANSTTLVANWDPVFGVMALNENDGTTTATGGASSGTTYDGTGTNNSLFLTPYDSTTGQGAGVYKRTGNDNSDYVFTKQSANDVVISAPTGIPVNYSFTDTLPGTATTSVTTNASSTAATRIFLGYYANGTGTEDAEDTTNPATKLINENGALTSNGVTAAENYDNDTPWVALYSTVKPTNIVEPDAYGYHFTGWHVGDDTSTLVSTANLPKIGETTAVAAVWAEDQYKLTYSCRNAANTLGSGTPSVSGQQSVTFDDAFTWASNTDSGTSQNCHQDGYHFTGWSCTTTRSGQDATQKTFANAASEMSCDNATNPGVCTGRTINYNDTYANQFNVADLVNGDNITCNAVYEKNVITITWTDPEGGTQGTNGTQNTCTYTEDVTIPTDPTRIGYEFTGWTVQE